MVYFHGSLTDCEKSIALVRPSRGTIGKFVRSELEIPAKHRQLYHPALLRPKFLGFIESKLSAGRQKRGLAKLFRLQRRLVFRKPANLLPIKNIDWRTL